MSTGEHYFWWNDAQRLLSDEVAEYAASNIVPRTRECEDTKRFPWEILDEIVIERKTYLVRCEAAILDCRPKLNDYPALIDKESYLYTQQVGARIHREGHPGLLNRSARYDGEIIAIFQQHVLTNPRPNCYLNYRIESGQVVIEKEPNKEWLRID